MLLARSWAEEAGTGGVGGDEAVPHIGSGLVVWLPNHRTQRRDHSLPCGAETLHGGDGLISHARERAPPARVGGPDDTGLRIRKQHRAAIRGRDTDGESRDPGYDSVSPGPCITPPGLHRH